MYYYQRLRDLREDEDLLQKQVCGIIECKAQQYQLYESGKRSFPIDLLPVFCSHYNVSADYILGLKQGLSWPRP